jgi:hypothetical protein
MNEIEPYPWDYGLSRGLINIEKDRNTLTSSAIDHRQHIENLKLLENYRKLEYKYECLQEQHNLTINLIRLHYPELLL